MARIGYARVSSSEQSLERQLKALESCSKVFQEKVSGKSLKRSELASMVDYLRDQDVVVITELDRLGRNNKELTEIMETIRKNRAVQYFSYPDYTFDYFRQQGITAFEGPADIALDEWILLKAITRDEQASFYLNNSEVPALVVNQLKLGADAIGAIGLFVDIGTEGFFKDLVITPF